MAVIPAAAAATSEAPRSSHEKGYDMMGLEWLRPGVFFGSMLFALLGVAVFWLCFVIVDKLTPYDLWKEIVEKQNLALAIVVGAMCIAIGLIVAAAVHG
jgi:hypothetical protein